MALIFAFITADSPDAYDAALFQFICMQKLTHDFPDTRRFDRYAMISGLSYCGLQRITCEDGLMQEMEYDTYTCFAIKNLDWFPPTLRRITCHGRNIESSLHTHLLPSRLEYLCIFDCVSRGSPRQAATAT